MKRFDGLQDTARATILEIVGTSTSPLSVSQITKRVNAERFPGLSSKELRQFVQNVSDRLVRHKALEIVKGAKRTGRPVNLYTLPAGAASSSPTVDQTPSN
jgi:hypothetical protein